MYRRQRARRKRNLLGALVQDTDKQSTSESTVCRSKKMPVRSYCTVNLYLYSIDTYVSRYSTSAAHISRGY